LGNTFKYQESLPKLPIPDLNETCDRFIQWVEPLLTVQQFEITKRIANEFKNKEGDGQKLQRVLKEFSEKNNLENWIAPFWYDVYLKPRVPLIEEGNVFYLLENKQNNCTLTQLELATSLILSVLKFKELIDNEELAVDMQKDQPLCMDQYKKFFSSTRIPQNQRDNLRVSSFEKHIIVLYKENIFVLNVYDNLEIKTYNQIKCELENIISEDSKGQGLGILTSMNRDMWADSRDRLLNIDDQNKGNLEKIETAIFALCLDDSSPEILKDVSENMLYGNGKNRWFDKSLQFIITRNGYIGFNMEHTGMDGSPISKMIKYIYDDTDSNISKNNVKKDIDKPEKLKFVINDELTEMLNIASEKFHDIISDNETRVLVFDQFGTNKIKKFQISPDAFVQLAIQLAQYKIFDKCFSQYEAVATRKFLYGRMEVMYAVSNESLRFIESFTSNCNNNEYKKILLINATQKHIERIRECQEGKGVDGHLMGLLEMYNRFGKEIGIDKMPALFKDEGYKTLTHSTICTSTTSTHGLQLAGWGPVVEDGFAIRYMKYKDEIRFNIMSRKYNEKNLDKLTNYIKESLLEMAKLMEV
jgi:carnitine O-acetyltransferase